MMCQSRPAPGRREDVVGHVRVDDVMEGLRGTVELEKPSRLHMLGGKVKENIVMLQQTIEDTEAGVARGALTLLLCRFNWSRIISLRLGRGL